MIKYVKPLFVNVSGYFSMSTRPEITEDFDMTYFFSHFVFEGWSLPAVFYWQLDNCFRDCKNINILGFGTFLVMAGVFKKVTKSVCLKA